MKDVKIRITEEREAQIAAAVEGGDFSDVSDLVDAALEAFLAARQGPTPEQIERDIDAFEAAQRRGDPTLTVDEARWAISAEIPLTELKVNPGAYLESAHSRRVLLTRRGRVVGELVPMDEASPAPVRPLLGCGAHLVAPDPALDLTAPSLLFREPGH